MERINNLTSSTLVVAILTLIGYGLYTSMEVAYLGTFGINNGATLVPLQVQAIVPSVAALVGYILIVTAIVVTYFERAVITERKGWSIFKLYGSLLNLTALPLYVVAFYDHQFWGVVIVLIIFNTIMIFSSILLTRRVNTSKVRTKKIPESGSLFYLKRYLQKIDSHEGIVLIIFMVMFLAVALLSVNSIGVYSARRGPKFYTTESDGSKYVLVRQYTNQVILARIVGNKIQPEYKVMYLDTTKSVSYKAISREELDFTLVDPNRLKIVESIKALGGSIKSK